MILTRLSVTHVIFAHLSASPTLHIYLPTDVIFLGQCNLRVRIVCCGCAFGLAILWLLNICFLKSYLYNVANVKGFLIDWGVLVNDMP